MALVRANRVFDWNLVFAELRVMRMHLDGAKTSWIKIGVEQNPGPGADTRTIDDDCPMACSRAIELFLNGIDESSTAVICDENGINPIANMRFPHEWEGCKYAKETCHCSLKNSQT